MDFKKKERYDFNDLVGIMRVLREPGGCPWDREQDHKSIRNNFIEEVYEAVEGIDTGNAAILREELGDVLLQVVFHARISEEAGEFDINDVTDEVCKKLIQRHPHIFSDTVADTSDEVLKNWDKIKQQTKKQTSYRQTMDGVSAALPALVRADKIGKKAAKAGFDFDDAPGAFEKVAEETAEVRAAMESGDKDKIAEEIGDLYFSVSNLARKLGVDSEQALYNANAKFVDRFGRMEEEAKRRNIELKHENMSEMDKIWDEIKGKR